MSIYKIGDKVWWNDPADEKSGVYRLLEQVDDTDVMIVKDDYMQVVSMNQIKSASHVILHKYCGTPIEMLRWVNSATGEVGDGSDGLEDYCPKCEDTISFSSTENAEDYIPYDNLSE